MQDITLQALLEAGCHFGHKAERWHPKASKFIYIEKDGIHIIDLAKTKTGLEAAAEYVRDIVAKGGDILFVGTKRQARGIVKQEAAAVSVPYFSERWIGGFLTNWDQIRKNIEKINRMTTDQASGAWKKFPKHEQSKMARYLERIKIYYGGVLAIAQVPQALFVVDVRKEIAAVREAQRRGVPVIGIVDTNSDPTNIDFVIPANDDAVGSVSFIVHYMAEAYKEGKALYGKLEKAAAEKQENEKLAAEKKMAEETAKMTVESEEKRLAEAKAKKAEKTAEKPKADKAK
ncbi:30S ribosomal protein S2 [Candidatus Gottesmanbacteria bacterium RIFCSPLOWO2_01_FULL_46_9]|uniref:Small ribosomal subunit protein uS2 n=1 Tax=Candidatus Gottesmanbacteria bacterium RIFCSPLOWO2_01_FULL_46_9 TaxID=1798394 RepID=A0A1F6AWW4_9BACT|nr:MAG: 30S ribosomal protein S2 [Candidatus Gottesmanbacteria bacterium RIFCSPLOWO2_01_FULL_46_9]